MVNLAQKMAVLGKIPLILSTLIFLNTASPAWSESTDTKDLRDQQQELKELVDRIGEAQEQRSKQHDKLKKLEKQMSCNWALIKDYDNCESEYKDNLEAHISCKQEAREKTAECLSSPAD